MSTSRGGRPRYEPTDKERAQCKALSAMGIPHADIALVLQISAPTLRRHFRAELDVGSVEANAKVAQSLFRQATDPTKPSTVACIFWLKTRAGWVEPSNHQQNENAPGKKEVANREARTAHNGTAWEKLLSPSAGSMQ